MKDKTRRVVQKLLFENQKQFMSSLMNELVAYWKFDEIIVTGAEPAIDTMAGLALVHTANPLSTTGIINNARAFVQASGQSMATAANPAALNFTGDFSTSFWVKFTTNVNQDILEKYSSANKGFAVTVSSQRLRWTVGKASDPSGPAVAVTDANFGTVSAGVWYHVYCWVTSGGVIGIRINDTAETTASFATFTPNPATNRLFAIGINNIAAFFNGAIDELGFWGRTLTAGEVTSLYNGGAGKTHPF